MFEALENEKMDAVEQGGTPGEHRGEDTKRVRGLRALGRTMLDVRQLVYNMGRSDFREKNSSAYALSIQESLGVPSTDALTATSNMFWDVGAIMEMSSIVSLVHRLSRAHLTTDWTARPPRRPKRLTRELVLLCSTLLAHRCWRRLPLLATSLTEILLFGRYKGVSLKDDTVFMSPQERSRSERDRAKATHGRSAGGVGGDLRATDRDQRFILALEGLDCLRKWALEERRQFMQRMFHVTLGGAPAVGGLDQRCSDLPPVLPDTELDIKGLEEEPPLEARSGTKVAVPRRASLHAGGSSVPTLAAGIHQDGDAHFIFDSSDARPQGNELDNAAINLESLVFGGRKLGDILWGAYLDDLRGEEPAKEGIEAEEELMQPRGSDDEEGEDEEDERFATIRGSASSGVGSSEPSTSWILRTYVKGGQQRYGIAWRSCWPQRLLKLTDERSRTLMHMDWLFNKTLFTADADPILDAELLQGSPQRCEKRCPELQEQMCQIHLLRNCTLVHE